MISGMETGKSAGGDGMSWVVHEDMRIEMTKGGYAFFCVPGISAGRLGV